MNQRIRRFLPKNGLAHAALLSAQLCFSGWHIVGSLALKDGADPLVFVLYRELFASFLMWSYVKYCGVKLYIEPEDRIRFVFLGLFSFMNCVGGMVALDYISATRYSIFQPSIPCIATFISIIVGLEKFTIVKACGIGLAVGGAVLTETWNASSSDDSEDNVALGTIIVTAQVVAMASLVVFAKPMLHKYNPAVVTVTYYFVGALFTLVLCGAWAYRFQASDFAFNGEPLPWAALAFACTFATFYTYNTYSWAGKQLTPGVTTVYSTFQPVGTIFLSFIILGSVVTLPEGVGTIMVIAGLVTTVVGQNKEAQDKNGNSYLLESNNSSDDDSNEVHSIDEDEQEQEEAIQIKRKLTEKLTGSSGFMAVPSSDHP